MGTPTMHVPRDIMTPLRVLSQLCGEEFHEQLLQHLRNFFQKNLTASQNFALFTDVQVMHIHETWKANLKHQFPRKPLV